MKVAVVVALKAAYPLGVLLPIVGLAPSTFFYHQHRRGRPDRQMALKTVIGAAFAQAHGRYGHRRIHACLVEAGWRVAKKTVLSLMRDLGLVCRVRRRRYTSYRGERGAVASNVLNREFTATAPNQKWVTDITEFKVGEQRVYLSPVMDLFERQIIAWSLATSPTVELTNRVLRDALVTLEPGQTPIVHSD